MKTQTRIAHGVPCFFSDPILPTQEDIDEMGALRAKTEAYALVSALSVGVLTESELENDVWDFPRCFIALCDRAGVKPQSIFPAEVN